MENFKEILSVITSESFYDIEQHWNSMPLAECIQSNSSFNKKINGLYALKHPRYGIIYIGKGKPIFRRIYSHYKATKGDEKAPAWRQFFMLINSDITVYWYTIDHKNPFVSEQFRETLERLLQIKYKPLFDSVYSKTRHKEVEDLVKAIDDILN